MGYRLFGIAFARLLFSLISGTLKYKVIGVRYMDLNKALSEIGDIRNQIAGQTLFQGFGPVVVVATGLVAVVVGLLQTLLPDPFAASRAGFLQVWIVAAVLAALLVAGHMLTRVQRLHGSQGGAMLNRIFEQLMPSFFVVSVITFAVFRFAAEFLNALPGLWLLLAALAVFTMTVSLGQLVRWVAIWYFVSGTVVLMVGLQQATAVMSPWLIAVPFAVGQFAMAAVLKFEHRSL